jgi:protease YdgD
MRIAAVAATIAACVLVSVAVGGGDDASFTRLSAISGASTPTQFANLEAEKQTGDGKPGAGAAPAQQGNDSCRWANDNECDDPDIGTGACPMGTDASDCRRIRAGIEDDSCRWARDNECDEPGFGTGACVQGTDRTDCGEITWMRNQTDRCATSFNGICEESARGGSGSCAARTDRSDCFTRDRPMRINDHFFGRDDRVRVNAQQAPWRFMGRFTNAEGEACTATLIARDVIITAAHCIHGENRVTTGGIFRPEAGGPEARAVAYQIDRRFNYRLFNTTDQIDGLDWALIRLDQPLGDRLGFAGVRNITGQGTRTAAGFELLQAGYSWDTGDTLSANINCNIVEAFSDGTFAHECDTTRGDSGSGFIVRNGNSFDLIGVDSNFRQNPNGPFIYIAVSAMSFQPHVADFVAGRSGTPFGAQAGGQGRK